MNKFFRFMLIIFIVFNMTACGSDSEENSESKNEVTAETNSEQNQSKPASIVETVLLDESSIKITAKEIVYDGIFGTDLKLLIENNSDKSLVVQTRNSSVNGYMLDSIMSVDVAAGKKANDSITFMSSDLELNGIEVIADMEFSFHIFNSADWETYLDTPQIKHQTSIAEDFKYSYDDSGTEVFDEKDIKIVVKGISENDSIVGPAIILYIHNYCNKAVTIQARDVSINGFMLDPIFSEDVMPGKRAISAVTFMSSDLEENGITEITEVELYFHIFDQNNWDTIIDSNLVNLKF